MLCLLRDAILDQKTGRMCLAWLLALKVKSLGPINTEKLAIRIEKEGENDQ